MARNIRYGNVSSVLPYLLQDDYSRELVPQETSVAILENSYLRAIVLLDFGGRLWSLQDKVGGRELLYNNDRIQLGNLGLRNAWFPGGVEWNLGTTGHTALTCSPVHAASLRFPDGAPGLRIYEWERMRDLVYQVDFRLGPRSRHLVVDIKVTNPNAHAVPAYWWSNIAVASSPASGSWCPAAPRSSSPMRNGSIAFPCRGPGGRPQLSACGDADRRPFLRAGSREAPLDRGSRRGRRRPAAGVHQTASWTEAVHLGEQSRRTSLAGIPHRLDRVLLRDPGRPDQDPARARSARSRR